MAAKRRASPRIEVAVGDWVLIGTARVTMPSDWFAAEVLWVGRGEVLTTHKTPTCSEGYRQVFAFDNIVRVGTVRELHEYQENSRRAVQDQQRIVRECELALSRAREAVWTKLESLRGSK